MLSVYHTINQASNEGTIRTDDFDIEFQKICGKYNINILLLDVETKAIKISINDYEIMRRLLLDYLFKEDR